MRSWWILCWWFGHRDQTELRDHPGNKYIRPGRRYFATCTRCGSTTWTFYPGMHRKWERGDAAA